MFGHHDDPLYGVGWEGDEGRSDVKSVCGDYPAVMSFDLGHIELEGEKSLDNVQFRKIRQETINQTSVEEWFLSAGTSTIRRQAKTHGM